MLRPAATQLISKNDSYYSLVIGVAKRAREIADELVEEKKILEEKPVKSSVEELANGKYRIIEAKEEETIQETEAPVLTEIEF
ncbi:MAG: DNA-directed RNA polymerase subunit omega [Ruminococcus sp.]|nr:DNA-directed RNA polymerase subunit omega [Ruminococcus sp.]